MIGLASPWGEGYVGQEQDEGDASVPSPLNPTPAPTGTEDEGDKRPLPAQSDPRPYSIQKTYQ